MYKIKRFSVELNMKDRFNLIKGGFRNGNAVRDNIRNDKTVFDSIKSAHKDNIRSQYNYIGGIKSGSYDESMTDVNKAQELINSKKSIKNSMKELKHMDKGESHYANRMRSKHIRHGFKSALGIKSEEF